MKMALKIFRRDLRRLGRNPAALLIAAGLCLIPALYAWLNLAAGRDPYSNTQGILVAVADCDEGAANERRSLDAGRKILDNLKENEELGWVFTDEAEALEGVKAGRYYAAIVIPEDFSRELLAIEAGEIGAPEIRYYVNEKRNAVAPKITDKGADAVQEKINQSFSEEASRAVAEELQDFGAGMAGTLETKSDEILGLLADTRANLAEYQQVLGAFQEDIAEGSARTTHAKETLGAASAAADAGSSALKEASGLTGEARKSLGDFSTAFAGSISAGEAWLTDIYTESTLKLNSLETGAGQTFKLLSAGAQYAEKLGADSQSAAEALESSVIPQIEAVIAQYEQGIEEEPAEQQKEALEALEALKGQLEVLKAALGELQAQNAVLTQTLESASAQNGRLTDTLASLGAVQTQLGAELSEGQETFRGLRENLNGSLLPAIGTALDTAAGTAGSAGTALADASAAAEELQALADQLDEGLTEGGEALFRAGETLASLDGRLEGMIRDLENLKASDVWEELLRLQAVDPEQAADFMASPVKLQSEIYYEVDSYGAAMMPFYTNLALWVGGMVLLAILKQEVDEDDRIRDFTPAQAYFGRELLFLLLAAVQALVVCLGNLYYLKLPCLHPALFVLTGLLASFVYLNLIYALAAAFKHVGRALFVLLVILQIPGSTGTYPVEMMGGFYEALSPFLPFTYSNAAMREAAAGMYGDLWLKNAGLLALFTLPALALGVVLGPSLLRVNAFFDRELQRTELILCERGSLSEERIAPDPSALERQYRRRKRESFLLMGLSPFLFLLAAADTVSKLAALTLWIAVLAGTAGYLIRLEYRHERRKKTV